ncbi:MAG: DUF2721 domain-containing protein [Desulfuromonadales bacterium]|nr:DUF2721 domain-containing protein [Desulfuromonadales bacterium]
MNEPSNVGEVAHVIQLAVAPAFLLTAIGAMMSVMTSRLARIIDRARLLEGRLENTANENISHLHADLVTLAHRAKLISIAITLCTTTAIMVCAVIAILFLGNFFQFNVSLAIALLFILAMVVLVIGLIIFLREVFIATSSLRIGPDVRGGFRQVPR